MNDPHIPVQSLDPNDDEALARWAVQLGVSVAVLREVVFAIGTDLDKIKIWLATRTDREGAS